MSQVVPSVLYTVESAGSREASRADLEAAVPAPEACFARLIREQAAPPREPSVAPDADPGIRPETR